MTTQLETKQPKSQSQFRTEIHILLISKSSDDAKWLRGQLKEAGIRFDITKAIDLKMATELISLKEFDLAVADLNTEGAPGIKIVQEVNALKNSLPVVVLSSGSEHRLAQEAVKVGAQDHLVRGCEHPELVSRILRYAIDIKQAECRIEALAHYDVLTGLVNRTLFTEHMQQALDRARRANGRLALFQIKIENFERFTETWGYSVSEGLLVEFVNRVKTCIRDTDTFSRSRTDEFSLLVESLNSAENCIILAEKISTALEKEYLIQGLTISIKFNMGIAVYPEAGTDLVSLSRNADSAIYRAQRNIDCHYHLYLSSMNVNDSQRIRLAEDLKEAVKAQSFNLYYQPIVTAEHREICAAEALLRWPHHEKGLIRPSEFVPLAEQTSFIMDIDIWTVDTVCKQQQVWKSVGCRPIPISVNLSIRTLRDDESIYKICQIVKKYGKDICGLEVEISETVILMNDSKINISLRKLRNSNIRIAINDFGFDKVCLTLPKNIHFDRLKLSRELIKNQFNNRIDNAIIESVVFFADKLGLDLTVTGVETEAQRNFFLDLGCKCLQGNLFGKPVTPSLLVSQL